MKKKLYPLFSLWILITLVLGACATTPSTPTTSAATEVATSVATEVAAEEPTEIVMAYPILSDVPKDLQLVNDALNKLTVEKVNVTVELMPIPIFQYGDQMSLMLSGSEKLDLMVTFSPIQNTSTMIQDGQLSDITDLLAKYGSGITTAIGPDFMQAVQVDGKYYGVPTLHDLATAVAVSMRTDLVQKYDIDTSKITSFDDLAPIFQVIKDNEPTIAPFFPGGTQLLPMDTVSLATVDKLGDGNGVLMDYGSDLTVVNYYASSEYAQMVNMIYSWYEKGYILTDAATVQEAQYDVVRAGKVFAIFVPYKPGEQQQDSRSSGMDMTTIQIAPAFSQTSLVSGVQWVVPHNSTNPQKAIELLNLFYTDPDVLNLFNYGIEGVHYVTKANNQIAFPEGITSADSPYYLGVQFLSGNEFITYTYDTDSPDLWQETQQYNTNAIKSKAFGFTFDSSNVQTQVAAVESVYQQYRVGLENGQLDPATTLPEFLDKLDKAGINDIIAEKQSQLDAWAAANNIN